LLLPIRRIQIYYSDILLSSDVARSLEVKIEIISRLETLLNSVKRTFLDHLFIFAYFGRI